MILQMQTKKDDILAASLVVFQEEGLKGARMERIAQAANVSKRTLYKHFESKETLFEAICAMVIETLSSMDMPEYDPLVLIDVQLIEAFRSYVRHTMTPQFLNCSRVILAEFMRNPDAAHVFNKAYRNIEVPLSKFLSQAMIAGCLRSTDPDAATGRLVALFKSMILIPTILNLNDVGAPNEQSVDAIVQESVQVFLTQYAP